MSEKPTITERSIDTETLVRHLRSLAVGGFSSYEELGGLIGRDVQNGARHILSSAMRILLREDRIVLAPVRDEGLKRLNDLEIVATGLETTARIRRLARRGARKVTAVENYDGLPKDAQVAHNTHLSIFGAIGQFTRPRIVERLTGAVEKAQHRLPLAKLLEAVKSNL
jgi:hypothetical protein